MRRSAAAGRRIIQSMDKRRGSEHNQEGGRCEQKSGLLELCDTSRDVRKQQLMEGTECRVILFNFHFYVH